VPVPIFGIVYGVSVSLKNSSFWAASLFHFWAALYGDFEPYAKQGFWAAAMFLGKRLEKSLLYKIRDRPSVEMAELNQLDYVHPTLSGFTFGYK
jgi:hypothetical protein